jgi:hypothetical protein
MAASLRYGIPSGPLSGRLGAVDARDSRADADALPRIYPVAAQLGQQRLAVVGDDDVPFIGCIGVAHAVERTAPSSAHVRSPAVLAVAIAVGVLAPGAQAAEPRWHPCRDAAPGARCGSVTVPLDRTGSTDATIRIEFELYRRRYRDRALLGTMVDVEGGPGYSTTDSRDYYIALHKPLMARRDLLLVDARGTGLSGALDCPALRRTVADYVRRAGT